MIVSIVTFRLWRTKTDAEACYTEEWIPRITSYNVCYTKLLRLVSYYESSPGNHRGFCRVCGSPLLSRFDHDPVYYGLPLGALDDDPGIRPKRHVFVAYKAPWFEITDDLPQFAELPTRAP